MEDQKVRVARKRGAPYTVNCPRTKRIFRFAASKKNFEDVKSLPHETYMYLKDETTALDMGELVVVDEVVSKEFKEQMSEADFEKINENIHSREEVVALLEGNANTMKAELKKITEESEKNFINQVASEIKLDSQAKLTFLAQWVNPSVVDGENEE